MRAEFVEAARWYAVEAGRFYATDFRNEVHRTLNLLCDHPPAKSNTRRMVVHRYPFFIVYRIDSDTLHVLAVAHHSRRPGYWVGRR
ncbi:MAG: type II toxin-antitoxin system RelE/ParE family toxin [Sulfuricella sp.]